MISKDLLFLVFSDIWGTAILGKQTFEAEATKRCLIDLINCPQSDRSNTEYVLCMFIAKAPSFSR